MAKMNIGNLVRRAYKETLDKSRDDYVRFRGGDANRSLGDEARRTRIQQQIDRATGVQRSIVNAPMIRASRMQSAVSAFTQPNGGIITNS